MVALSKIVYRELSQDPSIVFTAIRTTLFCLVLKGVRLHTPKRNIIMFSVAANDVRHETFNEAYEMQERVAR